VDHGNHPDLHRLTPEGPGRQVVIGGGASKARGVRDLIDDLALLPVEGGARVAIVEEAHRMNEDAQSAVLKTLEEPSGGVTIVLCADEEGLLLPTVRSRCARIRLGPVARRDIEAILVDHGVADPPAAARFARLAAGRPGVAIAYANAPDAATIRAEVTRSLLDLLDARPSVRLAGIRQIVGRVGTLLAAIEPTTKPQKVVPAEIGPDEDDLETGTGRRTPAAERRRSARALIDIWMDVTRDLALARLDMPGSLRDPSLLEEYAALADALAPGALPDFIGRLDRAGELIEANVTPELVLDHLVLAWPRRVAAA
jgi:hypothetical protein